MTRVLGAWDEHLAHPSLPRILAPAMRAAGFEDVRMEPHPFATAHFDPDSYGVAIIPAIRNFVSGRRGVSGDEAEAWASELSELGDRDEFYFAASSAASSARVHLDDWSTTRHREPRTRCVIRRTSGLSAWELACQASAATLSAGQPSFSVARQCPPDTVSDSPIGHAARRRHLYANYRQARRPVHLDS